MGVTATRVLQAMEQEGIDQPKLARDLGVSQGTISKIVSGKTANSRLMPRIAHRLNRSLPYLLGETDEAGATSSAPQITRHVLLAVALPSERALARMFEGLLRTLPPEADLAEQARLLAKRLPIGLSQLRDLLPESPALEASPDKEPAEALATPGLGPRS